MFPSVGLTGNRDRHVVRDRDRPRVGQNPDGVGLLEAAAGKQVPAREVQLCPQQPALDVAAGFVANPAGDRSHHGFLHPQPEDATGHHPLLDRCPRHQDDPDQALMPGKIVFDVEDMEPPPIAQEPLAVFMPPSPACGVELIGLVDQLKRARKLGMLRPVDDR